MPKDNVLNITAKTLGSNSGEILIYGYLLDRKWNPDSDDITAKEFNDLLDGFDDSVKNITLRVNSGGGSTIAGSAMATMIDDAKNRGIYFTGKNEGIAGSMAGALIQSCNIVVMSSNALYQIHKPSTYAGGNADQLQDYIDLLNKTEKNMIALYMRRFKGTEDELKALLKGKSGDGVFMTADEALEYGFIDKIDEPIQIAACVGGYDFNGTNVPDEVVASIKGKIKEHKIEGGEEEMLYNKEMDTQIKAFLDDGKVVSLSEDGKTVVGTEVLEATLVEGSIEITASQLEGLGMLEDASADTIVGSLASMIKAGIDISDVEAGLANLKPVESKELSEKAKAYDAIVAEETKTALANGVKAKGESFDTERWTKLLASLELGDVKAQGEEWLTEAKGELHAGRGRQSQVPVGASHTTVDPNEYKI